MQGIVAEIVDVRRDIRIKIDFVQRVTQPGEFVHDTDMLPIRQHDTFVW